MSGNMEEAIPDQLNNPRRQDPEEPGWTEEMWDQARKGIREHYSLMQELELEAFLDKWLARLKTENPAILFPPIPTDDWQP